MNTTSNSVTELRVSTVINNLDALLEILKPTYTSSILSNAISKDDKKTAPLEKEDITNIVNKLQELLDDKAINNLKQSRKHKEFKEAVTDMVSTVNRGSNITMSTSPKLSTTVILKAQLDSLDKLCDKTLAKHNTPIFHNIGNVIKHGLKAVINLNNKEVYEEEVKAMRYYIDATQHARNNTLSVVDEIKNILKDKDELSRKHASPQDRKSEDRRVAAKIAKQARVNKKFIGR